MTKRKLTIGVIFGGASGEHEVSIVSARSIIDNLDRTKYRIIPLAITRDGQWLKTSLSRKYLKTVELGPLKGYANKQDRPSSSQALELVAQGPIDLVFPIIHGTTGEDGSLQGLLEILDVPYVGSGVLGSAVGMDKVVQKQLVEQQGIAVTPYYELRHADWTANSSQQERAINRICGLPCFVKPANLGSSVGITKVTGQHQLRSALRTAFAFDTKVIIEKAVANTREFECAVLGNDRPRASVVGEVVPGNEFYDYRAKYISAQSKTLIPAPILKKISVEIKKTAVKVFRITNATGMARVDFLYNTRTKNLFFSEINTAPGFTSISMYAKLWAQSGVSYPELLNRLIQLAQELYGQKKALKTKIKTPVWYS